MSIIQEYETIRQNIGRGRFDSIEDYLIEINTNNKNILHLSDVLHDIKEYKKFNNWFRKSISPFKIIKHNNNNYAVILDQKYFCYDWVDEIKTNNAKYGDGHCYEDAFFEYLDSKAYRGYITNVLHFDSENGMFCVYCENQKDADSISYLLSSLYKDEEKMLNLIRKTKKEYDYDFNFTI